MPPFSPTIGSPFIELHTVDSTNNYAMQLVHAGMAQHGTTVFSHEQTKGRGQRGKWWLSLKNKNIAVSIVIVPSGLVLSQLPLFNMAIASGTHRFYSRYAGEDVTIKWPNDIFWNDRKAGGILIENSIQGHDWKCAIAGIGLNINQTEFDALQDKAVSLKQITGKEYDTVKLTEELCRDVDFYFQHLLKAPESIIEYHHRHLYKINQPVKLKKDNTVFEAVVKGVHPSGQLIVQHSMEELFSVGEVEWVI